MSNPLANLVGSILAIQSDHYGWKLRRIQNKWLIHIILIDMIKLSMFLIYILHIRLQPLLITLIASSLIQPYPLSPLLLLYPSNWWALYTALTPAKPISYRAVLFLWKAVRLCHFLSQKPPVTSHPTQNKVSNLYYALQGMCYLL